MHYDIIRNSFDEVSGRFRDLDRLSRKMKSKYGEDIYDQLAQRRVYRYMDRYQKEIADIKLHLRSKLILKLDQKCADAVFSMWWQGYEDMPPVVNACLESLNKLGKKVVILTEKNIHDHIYLPDYVWEKYAAGKIGKAAFSDIVRVSALAMYGGLWIDSTVYIAKDLPDYMVNGFFVFKQSPQLREVRSYANWWIASPAGNELLLDQLSYLLCYWKYEDIALDHYIFHIFFRKIIDNNEQYQDIMREMPTRITDQTHLLVKSYDEQYDSFKWRSMKETSPVFKCSYKSKGLSGYDTFFCKLCNGELE